MLLKEEEKNKPHATNLKQTLIGRAIKLTINTAKYYINLDITVKSYYKEKICKTNNVIFNVYLKLPILTLLNYFDCEINNKIYEELNDNGKIFFNMKFETFLFKKGFPFSKDNQITVSPEEEKLELPNINFSLPRCNEIYLDKFDYKLISLNSKDTEEFKKKIQEIFKSTTGSSNTISSLIPNIEQIIDSLIKKNQKPIFPY